MVGSECGLLVRLAPAQFLSLGDSHQIWIVFLEFWILESDSNNTPLVFDSEALPAKNFTARKA